MLVQSVSIGEMIGTVAREAWRRRVGIALGFVAVALIALVVGLMLPKKYVSETTILALEQNIVKELTAGVAVPTSLSDRAAMIRDVIFSRKVMLQILDDGGWMARKPTPVEQERYMKEISTRTTISGAACASSSSARSRPTSTTGTRPAPFRASCTARRPTSA